MDKNADTAQNGLSCTRPRKTYMGRTLAGKKNMNGRLHHPIKEVQFQASAHPSNPVRVAECNARTFLMRTRSISLHPWKGFKLDKCPNYHSSVVAPFFLLPNFADPDVLNWKPRSHSPMDCLHKRRLCGTTGCSQLNFRVSEVEGAM